MFRSIGRCRTGLFIVAGTLLAAGLSARETRGLRVLDSSTRGVIETPTDVPLVLEDEAPSLDLQLTILHGRLKAISDVREELALPFEAYAAALKSGAIDDAAIWACVSTIADVEIQDKYDGIMRTFGQRILAGQPGFDIAEFDMHDRPLSWRAGVPADPRDLEPKALCNTCTTPVALAPATLACQYVSGNTTASCISDFYSLSLTAGQSYVFTMCTATCPSATFGYDTRIIIRQSGTCAVLVNIDDFCGLGSQATFTPGTTATYIIEVTGFVTSSVGPYTMGYRQNPPSTCGTCAAPLFTLTPTTTCQTVSNSNSSCPDPSCTSTTTSGGVWYNLNLIGGRSYTFSTCPTNAAGGSCFGTAAYDTRIDLWNSACSTRLAGNDDIACSLIFRSAFLYTPATSGVYKLQVRGFCGEVGTYTLAYQEQSACVAAAIISNSPTTGSTNATNCSVTQTFTVGLAALSTPPFTGTFTITPGAGGSASPTSGSMTFSGTNGNFTSTLTKAPCGVTNFTISATVTNCAGVPNNRTWTYVLADTTPPNAVGCPPSVNVDCSAPAPPATPPTATDNCDPAPTVTFAQVTIPGSCPGNRTLQRNWTMRDCNNNIRVCTQNVNFRDTTPPSIAGLDEWCMYPPNHEYYCIQASDLSPTISDDCSLPATLVVVGCVSNEPDNGTGDGDFPNDCIVSPDGKEICLRVERAGNLRDRVYGILGVAIDACGNRSAPTAIAAATVPHDDSEHPECVRANSGLDKRF